MSLKKLFVRAGLFVLFLALVFSLLTCSDKDQEFIPEPGSCKPEKHFGEIVSDIPNNIGNTFTGDPGTTRTITWQSTSSNGEVVIGKSRFPSTSTLNTTFTTDRFYSHRVDLTNLLPGTTYNYFVGRENFYSSVYSFTTKPANLPDGFYVIHITDPQVTNKDTAAVWGRVIEAAIKKYPTSAFVVNTGDVVKKTIRVGDQRDHRQIGILTFYHNLLYLTRWTGRNIQKRRSG